MSTTNMYKYVHGETYTAEKIPQPIAGTGFVDVVGSDGITPLAFTAIALFDDALGTTELTIDVDFEVGSEDARYTALEGESVYRSIRILNASYQSAVFYVDASVVGGYAVDSETILTQFKTLDNTFSGDDTFSASAIFSGNVLVSGSALFTGVTPQVASAWVNFNGTGTVAIRDDYNVDSITDNGTGDYTVNIDVDLADANYSAIATTGNATANLYDTTIHEVSGSRSVGACRFYTSNVGNAAVDPAYVSVNIFGGN